MHLSTESLSQSSMLVANLPLWSACEPLGFFFRRRARSKPPTKYPSLLIGDGVYPSKGKPKSYMLPEITHCLVGKVDFSNFHIASKRCIPNSNSGHVPQLLSGLKLYDKSRSLKIPGQMSLVSTRLSLRNDCGIWSGYATGDVCLYMPCWPFLE